MWLDVAKLAWLAIAERKGRAALAAFGVFVAFLALSVALSIGEAFRSAVASAFEQMGLNTVWLVAQSTPLSDADVSLAQAALGEAVVVPIGGEAGKLKLPDGGEVGVTVYYVPPEVLNALIPPEAVKTGQRYVGGSLALVSDEVRMAGDLPIQSGTPVTVERLDGSTIELVVAGTYDLAGAPHPLAGKGVVADAALSTRREYFMLYIVTKSPQEAAAAAEKLRPYFPDALILSPELLLRQVGQVVSTAQLGLGALAGVSALVTAMWLYDTTTISVLQRTKEIGIMRALGYKRRHILAMLLLEALMITAVGVAASLPVLAALSAVPVPVGVAAFRITPSPLAVATSLTIVITANIIGVLPPSYRASRLNVVDALRYE
ncbi:MAG: ABC transporter permease [Pyrobaculum sp.]